MTQGILRAAVLLTAAATLSLLLAAPVTAQQPKPEDLKKHQTTPGEQYVSS